MHFGDGGFPVTFTARSLEAKYIVEHTATREKTRIVMLDGMGEKKKIPIAMIEIKHPSRSDTLDVFKQAKFYTINLLFFLACCFSALVFMV